MTEYLDIEEQEIIDSLHSEKWQPVRNKELLKEFEAYAKNFIEFNKKIELNLREDDISKFKAKALQEGIPYEALISMLIHKYNEGKIAFTV
ncbi:MAG: antitoxin [bacterium]